MRKIRLLSLLLAIAGLLFVSINPLVAAYYSSGAYSSSSYGSCTYGDTCSITIGSSGPISLNVTPTPAASCTINSDTVSVLTDDANGYILTLSDGNTDTSLVNGSASISATSGTFDSPIALTADTWGYRVDSLGNFGNGPTTSQNNTSLSSTTFAAVQPSSGAADTIASTSTVADPAVNTKVWYGVCADTTVTSGSYSTQVTYTALSN
ncbi:MAG TPA: hypothetical protein VMR08_01130 [Patescibacteria group bacterium]|jgi:hypothetical protein|nr:hypothetical protein [Patescibacteria group bacterium]